MRKIPVYKTKFNQAYSNSSPELRELFDNPNTREQAGDLYNAWRTYETHRQKYQAGQLRRRTKTSKLSKGLDFEAEAKSSVNRDLSALLWFCEFMGKAVD